MANFLIEEPEEKKEKSQKEIIQERIKAKCDKYKNQGYADKEFRKDLNGKKIVMTLPNNVFDQQKLLNLADTVLNNNYDFYTSNELEEKYLKEVANKTLIDGQELSSILGHKDFELPQLQTLSVLYYTELLAPLSQWRDIIAKEILM